MSNAWSMPHLVGSQRPTVNRAGRRLWFESMEPRVMLAVDTAVGMPSLLIGSTGGMTGSIGGSVLAAAAETDCTAHETAVGMNEVRLQLLDGSGSVVEETTTDADGNYQFLDLIPGDYTVRRVPTSAELAADIALSQQEIGAIDLQGGEALTGFDFCQFVVSTSVSAENLAAQTQLAAVLGVTQQESVAETTAVVFPPTVAFVATSNSVPTTPLPTVPSSDFFGGSSRELRTAKSIKAWDEFPSMGLSSTLSLIDSSRNAQAIEDLVGSEDAENDSAFADGYTVNSLDWLDATDVEVRDVIDGAENLGDLELKEAAAENARTLPKLASRTSANNQQQ